MGGWCRLALRVRAEDGASEGRRLLLDRDLSPHTTAALHLKIKVRHIPTHSTPYKLDERSWLGRLQTDRLSAGYSGLRCARALPQPP